MEVRINDYGEQGLFSTRYYKEGEVLLAITGKPVAYPSKYSVQLGQHEHIEPDNLFRYTNHHCQPNAVVKGRQLIAQGNIYPGKEITFDYNTTEDVLANPFVCNCCNRIIRGKLYEDQYRLSEIPQFGLESSNSSQ